MRRPAAAHCAHLCIYSRQRRQNERVAPVAMVLEIGLVVFAVVADQVIVSFENKPRL